MRNFILAFTALILTTSCTNNHFITDKKYRNKVEKRFNMRKNFAKNRNTQLFDVFSKDINTEEKEALQFLYAYMPLSDLADYNGDFFLKQIRASLDARQTFTWGKTIPENIFRHFVLPYRINNENLDSARMVFLKELKPRLKGLTMRQAALEVNHWCHEKVNYTPTDERTSGPLSLIRTSWGRCGEESTFTVTAMRAVAIPARQVYTPRWAHCDDNHAWVEVWIDGKWQYLGACEPEPDMNMAWFSEPARRAMLVHTKVFGDYSGNDEVVKKSDNFTEINVVNNYAKTKKIWVKVIDNNKNTAPNALVDFGLYNYAEFYPIAKKTTNKDGICSLTTGLGDLLIWASKKGKYAGKKVTISTTDTLILELGTEIENTKQHIANLHFTPPIEPKPLAVDAQKKQENNKLLAKEDKMRANYRATFIDSIKAYQFAQTNQLNPKATWQLLHKSQGNWQAIKNFLQENNTTMAIALLQQLASKDLRDTKTSILADYLKNTINNYNKKDYSSSDIFTQYVLAPRVRNEALVPYKGYLKNIFTKQFTGNRAEKVTQIKQWIIKNIKINNKENYYSLPVTPIGVYELKIANTKSRDIFFVALCRSLGIPSRLEPTEKIPQFYNAKKWINIYFEQQNKTQPITGKLELIYNNKSFNPNYYGHFTIGKLNNGRYETLDYGWDTKLSAMPKQLTLEIGKYRLITGKRGADGTVYTHFNYFEITKDKITKVKLIFQNPDKKNFSFGKIDMNSTLNCNKKITSLANLKKNNTLILMWLEPGKEPTRHLLEELKTARKTYNNLDIPIVLMQQPNSKYPENLTKLMPNNCTFANDINSKIFANLKQILDLKGKIEKPFVVLLNGSGAIRFYSLGYKIGIHESIIDLSKQK